MNFNLSSLLRPLKLVCVELVWNGKFTAKALWLWISLAKIHNDLDLKINSPFCIDGNWLQKCSPHSSLQGIFWSNCRVNPIPKSSRYVKTLILPRVIWKYHMMWKDWKSTCHTLMLLKGCCWTIRLRDSWPPEETNSIRCQRRGWIAQSFCVIKFY